MNFDFLKELYEKGYFSIYEKFDDWHDAVQACVEPLVKDGAVEAAYVQNIFDNVAEYGPYICIAPDVCIPHAMSHGNVKKSSICFMKCNTPVVFDMEENHQSRIFFALAADNPDEHLDNMQKLMEMLMQDDMVETLVEAKTEEDFKKLIYG